MPILEINQLHFQWPNSTTHRLFIDSLRLNKGEKLLLRGNSGVGKSTLLNLICGVLTPTSGEIHLADKPLTQLKSNAIDQLRADHIGIIYQQFNLLPYLGVMENVLLPLRFSRIRRAALKQTPEEEATSLLVAMGLDEALHTQSVSRLSIGQQQRVAAARALIGTPKLIIADEPTSALDPVNRDGFIQLLEARCDATQCALVLVSHDPALGAGFDQIKTLSQSADTQEVTLC